MHGSHRPSGAAHRNKRTGLLAREFARLVEGAGGTAAAQGGGSADLFTSSAVGSVPRVAIRSRCSASRRQVSAICRIMRRCPSAIASLASRSRSAAVVGCSPASIMTGISKRAIHATVGVNPVDNVDNGNAAAISETPRQTGGRSECPRTGTAAGCALYALIKE